MKPKEREFCRLMTVYADPLRAAKEAGYKDPERSWSELCGRKEIAEEIGRLSENIRSIYESTAVCGLYRLAYGGIGDPLKLIYSESISPDELSGLDMLNVSEIKRTKDKAVEVKFFDRIKALDKLNEVLGTDSAAGSSGGLIEAMLASAEALAGSGGVTPDEV